MKQAVLQCITHQGSVVVMHRKIRREHALTIPLPTHFRLHFYYFSIAKFRFSIHEWCTKGLKTLLVEVAPHMDRSKICQHANKIILMRTNDINAANTSGQKMLYALPLARERKKTG